MSNSSPGCSDLAAGVARVSTYWRPRNSKRGETNCLNSARRCSARLSQCLSSAAGTTRPNRVYFAGGGMGASSLAGRAMTAGGKPVIQMPSWPNLNLSWWPGDRKPAAPSSGALPPGGNRRRDGSACPGRGLQWPRGRTRWPVSSPWARLWRGAQRSMASTAEGTITMP